MSHDFFFRIKYFNSTRGFFWANLFSLTLGRVALLRVEKFFFSHEMKSLDMLHTVP